MRAWAFPIQTRRGGRDVDGQNVIIEPFEIISSLSPQDEDDITIYSTSPKNKECSFTAIRTTSCPPGSACYVRDELHSFF